jgi:hypothetical protein
MNITIENSSACSPATQLTTRSNNVDTPRTNHQEDRSESTTENSLSDNRFANGM